jgi:hypothetical protein
MYEEGNQEIASALDFSSGVLYSFVLILILLYKLMCESYIKEYTFYE